MRLFAPIALILLACAAISQLSAAPKPAVDELIPWLLNEDQQLRSVPFSEVIFDSTGKRVLPFDRDNPADLRVAKAISAACEQTIKR